MHPAGERDQMPYPASKSENIYDIMSLRSVLISLNWTGDANNDELMPAKYIGNDHDTSRILSKWIREAVYLNAESDSERASMSGAIPRRGTSFTDDRPIRGLPSLPVTGSAEAMNRGYVKTWRKTLDKGWIKNHKLWAFWSWCLLKASHREHDVIVGVQTIHLMPGQFVFGRKKAAEETGLTERETRTVLASLISWGNLTSKTTNKYSIITIVNWHTYQDGESRNDQQNDQPLTRKRPATDHKQECKEFK